VSSVGFACRCGEIRGHLTHVDHSAGTHLRCHCDDCRRANAHFGMDGTREDGVCIWQTTPDKVKVDEGAVHLRLMRLSEKGLLRWFAGCCDTPLFNTLATPKVPFVGVLTDRLDDIAPLGPVVAEGFVEGDDGKSRHVGGGRVARGFVRRALGARLSGRWKDNPFFDTTTGQPIRAAEIEETGD
jgi:hypothetical protein